MSMIPCPGCGLPRVEDQVGVVPCPVCATAADAGQPRPGPAKKPAGPDPTAGLPADVGELGRFAAHPGGGFAGAFLFVLGAAVGVGGVLGWQAAFPPGTPGDPLPPVEVASAFRPAPAPPGPRVEVAPMPHEPALPQKADVTPEPAPDPKPVTEPPLPGRVVTVELNQPNGTYTVPFAMKKGEHVVLKGEVKTLKVTGLDAGAVLDAAGLKAAEITVTGRIDNRSVLKLHAPNGLVTVTASVVGHSSVEILAPGGEVRFGTKAAKAAGQIDAGSTVAVTARGVDLRGDVNGVETRVTVNLPRSGWLHVAAVRGIATVEYRVADGKGEPDVKVDHVSPTANFRKIE